ncbi:MAG: UPF0182 family protein [Anaerolineae bacterium]|nr:UPF0182 family protein [Anaerolineae bacterium]MDW8102129.1 UPF0182 family protein [Anaerolineae bacterium]
MSGRKKDEFELILGTSPRSLPWERWLQWALVLFSLWIALLFFPGRLLNFWITWEWFRDLGYESVFWTQWQTRALLFLVGWTIAALFLGLNAFLAARAAGRSPRLWLNLAVAMGFFFGLALQRRWESILLALNAEKFGVADPIFGQDVSWYVFQWPLWIFFQRLAQWGLAPLSALFPLILPVSRRWRWAHLSVLAAFFFLLMAIGYRFDAYHLLYVERPIAFGAGYTEIHARLPALNLLTALMVFLAIVLMLNLWLRQPSLFVFGFGGWLILAFLGLKVYPSLIQTLVVRPNELERESPYLAHSIAFTRRAYGLDRFEEREFAPREAPTPEEIKTNKEILDGIRLWDYRPLLQTLQQIQSIRPYYVFVDVDVDRYRIDGVYRQVMLSVRELDIEALPAPARTWVNRHLVFTHGYGAVMVPVNAFTPEGLPQFLLKDIPPVGAIPLTQPQIYFGERTFDFVLVNTRVPEFDYPRGEENVTTIYQGRTGVKLGGFLRRTLFALYFGDPNLFLSGALTPESRILFWRDIRTRLRMLAPFLRFDADPYAVILDGRIVWVADAYTWTDRYPYSQPYYGLNYIRNSVKAVIDAYDGTVTFYVVEEEPIIRAWRRVFPALWRDFTEMPEELRAHLRYPEGLFRIQAEILRTYHVQDPRTFYNKEDVWAIPLELFAEKPQDMEPYYVQTRVDPGGPVEFVLILPFTPSGRQNMIAWMAARSDPQKYGGVVLYQMTKERLIFGPQQIEARIDQDPVISAQLTLWGQRGSQVIRGNLLVIPIGEAFLYVEPLYLLAEQSHIPELKQVIVATEQRVAMAPTLEQALAQAIGTAPVYGPPGPAVPADKDISTLIQQAYAHYQRAQEAIRQGDWATYGAEIEALGRVLQSLLDAIRER